MHSCMLFEISRHIFSCGKINRLNPIWDGVENRRGVQHQPLLNTRNHCETPQFFDFQTGRIEIRQVTKFGVFGVLIYSKGELNTLPVSNRVKLIVVTSINPSYNNSSI